MKRYLRLLYLKTGNEMSCLINHFSFTHDSSPIKYGLFSDGFSLDILNDGISFWIVTNYNEDGKLTIEAYGEFKEGETEKILKEPLVIDWPF